MHIIIPARYASTRLPGKPLADIGGKPLVQHVYERACEAGAQSVAIATDDQRIYDVAQGFGAYACMTAVEHRSGTDRLAEAIQRLGIGDDEIVVNLQGDEPLMSPTLIRAVSDMLMSHTSAHMATACHAIDTRAEFTNPNVVKVALDANGYALYFSRAPIPWPRDAMSDPAQAPTHGYRHIGLYAFRAGFVRRYASWAPCELELTEQLEQLRVLWHGERIAVYITSEAPGPGVDTVSDLERVRELFKLRKSSR